MNALVTPYQGALTIVGIDLSPHIAVRIEGLHEPGFSGVLRPQRFKDTRYTLKLKP